MNSERLLKAMIRASAFEFPTDAHFCQYKAATSKEIGAIGLFESSTVKLAD